MDDSKVKKSDSILGPEALQLLLAANRAALGLLVACAVHVLALVLALVLWNGGSAVNPQPAGFDPAANRLAQLLLPVGFAGAANPARLSGALAQAALAGGLIMAFAALSRLRPAGRSWRRLAVQAALVPGLFAGLVQVALVLFAPEPASWLGRNLAVLGILAGGLANLLVLPFFAWSGTGTGRLVLLAVLGLGQVVLGGVQLAGSAGSLAGWLDLAGQGLWLGGLGLLAGLVPRRLDQLARSGQPGPSPD